MSMDAIGPGKTALVTGGADGIGLAVACRLAAAGMAVVIADVQEGLFAGAEAQLRAAGAPEVLMARLDVSDRAALVALGGEVADRFGGIDVLMCNAGVQPGSDIFDERATWDRIMAVNLGGVTTACQVLVPGMIARGRPGLVINTGSKQGITTPPGDPAYNVAKAGVKVFTEALEHHLRGLGGQVSAHLLIPGFVWTGLTRGARTEKPAGAWTPAQTADFLMESLARGDFYILCPDNDVSRALDEKRIAWAAGDLIENRPPLSRWHKDWAEGFAAYLRG